ncbi:hypothetical protein B9Z55_025922 [Caenorhabditis nigoni]|uniref:Uncharacterized protein n=1 Tax=Caenorhabditis nigoni TaxID=1611254 RepID=A0A2G5T165_9PELO|nr:hypothetical protein B9Z55_025922 [Caenorhabditis nigoni]
MRRECASRQRAEKTTMYAANCWLSIQRLCIGRPRRPFSAKAAAADTHTRWAGIGEEEIERESVYGYDCTSLKPQKRGLGQFFGSNQG